MRRPVRIALWTVAAVVALMVFVGAGAAIMVLRHTTVSSPSAEQAGQAFEQVRSRFPARPPLVEVGDPRRMHVRVNRPPETAPRHAVQAFHVLAWDGRDGKLVQSRAPVWWMRFSLENLAAELGIPMGPWALTVADVERYGPGIVMDYAPPGGGRVLAWVE